MARSLSISVLNQVISSGANFALGLYLVRVLSPTEFGLYGIGFAIVLFYAGVGNALFLTQMVVHVPEKAPEERLLYAARMLAALLIFCVLTAMPALAILGVGKLVWPLLNEYVGSLVAVLASCLAYLLKDFFVRHAYTARKEVWALIVNSAIAIVMLASLLVWHHGASDVSATGALWIFAMSNLVGVLVGLLLVKLPLSLVTANKVILDWKEAWRGGVWALGGGVVIWSQSQAYIYVTALIAGPAAVGMANAAKLLITPALFLVTAANQILMPRLATLRVTNINKMFKTSEYVALAFILFAMMYTLFCAFWGGEILAIIVGNKYQDIAPLILAWCLVLIFQFSRAGTSVVLQVMKEFKRIMFDNLWSAVVAIICTVFLLKQLGVQGAVLGAAIGELILSVLLYRAVLVHKRKAALSRT
ncbi:lipopolysaccharide biosynthesis protein [Ferriphaselus amnicola]|nr:oligosaccharide flippase family protein [Ferriphaselus amnicola]